MPKQRGLLKFHYLLLALHFSKNLIAYSEKPQNLEVASGFGFFLIFSSFNYYFFKNLLPCDIKCLLNFCLYRSKQISTHFFQQLCQQYKQPVLQIFFMDLDEVHQCLQKHTEHLKGRRRWKEGRMGQKRK